MAKGDLVPPCTYQGAKVRLADEIAQEILAVGGPPYHDLCCGSGAVSMALIRRGVEPSAIRMVDASPWGEIYLRIGRGTFDLSEFDRAIAGIPADPAKIKAHVEAAYRSTPTIYAFLILQASTIGGAPVWIENGVWRRGGGFRDYWLPTATSSRRSPVNPMMPMPATLQQRVHQIAREMRGVLGFSLDVTDYRAESGTVYVDPPYAGLTGYGPGKPFDVGHLAQNALSSGARAALVSEARPVGPNAKELCGGRAKGGMTGQRKSAASEWLTTLAA